MAGIEPASKEFVQKLTTGIVDLFVSCVPGPDRQGHEFANRFILCWCIGVAQLASRFDYAHSQPLGQRPG